MTQSTHFTTEQAIALSETKFWEHLTHEEIARFQMAEEKLCMPFGVFHEALEKTLGRGVFTHEFALNFEGLQKELYGEAMAPTLSEIIAMIPEDKRIVIELEP